MNFFFAFIFVATFLFFLYFKFGVYETIAFKPEPKVKTRSAGFKLAKGLSAAPSS